MKTNSIITSLLAVIAGTLSLSAHSAPIKWEGNGHYYDLIPKSNLVNTWEFARDHAATQSFTNPETGEVMVGHLATITSAGENDFLDTTWGFEGWIGGYQDLTVPGVDLGDNNVADADEGWHWVTGETWDYTAWSDLEPNDQGPGPGDPLYVEDGGEDVLLFWSTGLWNDWLTTAKTGKYYIEYEPAAVAAVPVPAAVWLFASGLLGLVGVARRKKS